MNNEQNLTATVKAPRTRAEATAAFEAALASIHAKQRERVQEHHRKVYLKTEKDLMKFVKENQLQWFVVDYSVRRFSITVVRWNGETEEINMRSRGAPVGTDRWKLHKHLREYRVAPKWEYLHELQLEMYETAVEEGAIRHLRPWPDRIMDIEVYLKLPRYKLFKYLNMKHGLSRATEL